MLQGLGGFWIIREKPMTLQYLFQRLYNTETLEDVYIYLDLSKEKKNKNNWFFFLLPLFLFS